MQNKDHKSKWKILVEEATKMIPRGRSGAFTPSMDFFRPYQYKFYYTGPHTIHGRIKHAGEVRRVKKRQRRRNFFRSLRRSK